MAEANDLLEKFRVQTTSWDLEAWTRWSNAGLVKRATKDLEKGLNPILVQSSETQLSFRLNENSLTVPAEGLLKARCSCPAPGVCHHLVLLGLWLASSKPAVEATQATSAASASPAGAILDSILQLSTQDLLTWLGKRSWQVCGIRAQACLENVSIEEKGERLMVNIDGWELLFVPPHPLEQVLASGKPVASSPLKTSKLAIGAAIIAFKLKHGQELLFEQKSGEAAPVDARAEATLVQIQQALEALIQRGIAHLSRGSLRSLSTLAEHAQSADLPRLGRLLESLASRAQQILDSQAQGDSAQVFSLSSKIWMLVTRLLLPDAPESLRGQHRADYDEKPLLQVQGLGTWIWTSPSGYKGISLLLGHAQTGEIYTVSEARPAHSPDGFSPEKAYTQTGPWGVGKSYASLSNAHLELKQVRMSQTKRISPHPQTQVNPLAQDPSPDDWERLTLHDWTTLVQRQRLVSPPGLQQAQPWQAAVLLRPSDWEDASYSPTSQTLMRGILDEGKRRIWLSIPLTQYTENVILHLSQLTRSELKGCLVSGIIQNSASGLSVFPVALIWISAKGDKGWGEKTKRVKVINLGLDYQAPAKKSFGFGLKPSSKLYLPQIYEDEMWQDEKPLSVVENKLELVLLNIAERGTDHFARSKGSELRQLESELHSSGHGLLARALARLGRNDTLRAKDVLQCKYLSDLVSRV